MEMNGGVPCRTSLVPHCFPLFCTLLGVETEGLLGYQGRAGVISIVRWNLRPVIFGVERIAQRSTFESGHRPVGWGSSTRRGGDRKVRSILRNAKKPNFLSGIFRELCWGGPGALGVFEKLMQKKLVLILQPSMSLRFAAMSLSFMAIVFITKAFLKAIDTWKGCISQERKKHINIKTYPGNPPVRIPPKKFFMWGFFSWKIKEKRPPPPHKESGLSDLYARDPPPPLFFMWVFFMFFFFSLANICCTS